MTVIDRLDAVREQWNVLRHPFYQRWSAGELERPELAFYAGEYRHAVVALADATAAAAAEVAGEPALREDLEQHAAEERAHVAMWDRFAEGVGGEVDRPAQAESSECAAAWTAGDDLLERLAVLYAVEAGQPAISQTKLEGLRDHYEMGDESPASSYFALHAELDHQHAAHSRELLLERASESDADRLVARAEAALRGNWRLLDGVDAQFGHAPEALAA